jgi:predicted nucleic acid-binding protein
VIYVFDTNVLSEVMKEEPHPSVITWLRACPAEAMFTTAISCSEILYGIRRLPHGAKRLRLERAAHAMFSQEFEGRVLPFDALAADIHANLRLSRAQSGRPLAAEDGMIAAIARSREAAVVTRDVGGFEQCGITLVNPWQQ